MPQSPEHAAGSVDPEIDSLKQEVERLRPENALLREQLDREHIERPPVLPRQRTDASRAIRPTAFDVHADFGQSSPARVPRHGIYDS